VHKIYISPSTFEYSTEKENLLWGSPEDLALLEKIKSVKRESRIARDNSEDALCWNTFRFLEKNGLLPELLLLISGVRSDEVNLVYWSYDQQQDGVWSDLVKARQEFGELPQRSTEPDLIASTSNVIYFFEMKFQASNNTKPSSLKNKNKYQTGGGNWYNIVFRSAYETVALQQRKYELMRHWLIGSWLAAQRKAAFYLLNLVPSENEIDIEGRFFSQIIQNSQRNFKRICWEDIYKFLKDNEPDSHEKKSLINYLEQKTRGYDNKGNLKHGFIL
jgi:hypothetical protein